MSESNGNNGRSVEEQTANVERYKAAIDKRADILVEIDEATQLVAKALKARVQPAGGRGDAVEVKTADLCQIGKTLGYLRALYKIDEKGGTGSAAATGYEEFIRQHSGDGAKGL